MRHRQQWISAGLLTTFVAIHTLAALCLFAMPLVAESMPHCPMGMAEHEGPAVSADMNCCLTSVAEAGQWSSAFVSLETLTAVFAPEEAVFPTSPETVLHSTRETAAVPQISPPRFLLTGSFLI
jgi:hypothetical protein